MLEAFSTFLCEICAEFLPWELSCHLPSAWVLLGWKSNLWLALL